MSTRAELVQKVQILWEIACGWSHLTNKNWDEKQKWQAASQRHYEAQQELKQWDATVDLRLVELEAELAWLRVVGNRMLLDLQQHRLDDYGQIAALWNSPPLQAEEPQ